MRLELNVINIKKVQFTKKTGIDKGMLSINREELQKILEEDTRLGSVDIELAQPGEKCRITRVFDAIEPRARLGNGSVDFPGALGKQGVVGDGKTCVLRGAAVLTSQCFTGAEGQSRRAAGGIVDMWGPGAEVGPYGGTCNVVLLPSPSQGTSLSDYLVAIKIAGLKTAVYLAKAGVDLTPNETEVYDMEPFPLTRRDLPELPRVAYIFQIFSNQQLPLPGDPVFYGDNIDGIVPTIIHPNEVFDGAITTLSIDTYLLQNHPILKELYRNHGKSLYLVGVIITNAPNNGPAIERAATIAANQAKFILRADGVILTKYGGGAPEMTMGATAQKCERLGIRTALAIQHAGLDTAEISLKPSTIFTDTPEVDAIVSLGTNVGGPDLTLPVPERVIGMDSVQLAKELVRQVSQIKGATSLIGNSKLMTVRY
ncbi:MAG: glycine/sarcosine/betaine reductase component B subunit [Chloroflexota bacterium]